MSEYVRPPLRLRDVGFLVALFSIFCSVRVVYAWSVVSRVMRGKPFKSFDQFLGGM